MPTAVEYALLHPAVQGPSLFPAPGVLPQGCAGLVLSAAGSHASGGGGGAGRTQGLIIVV